MNKIINFILLVVVGLMISNNSFGDPLEKSNESNVSNSVQVSHPRSLETIKLVSSIENSDDSNDSVHHDVPGWTVIPFILLLLSIATGPLFFEHFWHKNYPKISFFLASVVVIYYLFALKDTTGPIHALIEYIPFISLLAALYIASGGISINIDRKATTFANIGVLSFGAVIANIIGTTGASMLLIRPFIRLNKTLIRPYHIVFFIFIVSNIGGSLTPIGDPPLFLGFLKGVPFEWTLVHNLAPWFAATILLCVAFFFVDKKRKKILNKMQAPEKSPSGKVSIQGARNFIWLAITIAAVFLDPNILDWVPSISYHGMKISFIKEVIWVFVAFASFKFADKKAVKANDFSFEPIMEVAFLFVGIFATMMPAIELVGSFASSEQGAKLITHNTLYWGTGLLSGLLDNAPTYINFLTAAIASKGGDVTIMADVIKFSNGGFPDSILSLKAIAVASVFFGAMTYIGNGPNFMVKSIAEEIGIKMPSFFGYIVRYSIPILLPILFVIWLIFFAFH